MKFNVFKLVEKIPNEYLKKRVLDNVFDFAVPFNLTLGMKIQHISKDAVEVVSHNRWKTHNHVGGAHACFLALMGEYPAGLLLAQNFTPDHYRLIIGELKMTYHKQGRGTLKSVSRITAPLPAVGEEETWIPMTTQIYNSKGENVATAETHWQLKKWSAVGK